MDDSELTTSPPLEMDTQNICYLSAPSHINLKTLRELLAVKGMRPITESELPSTTTTILGDVVKAISKAKIFIAVLDSKENNAHVYFELGIAAANEVHILLILYPDVNLAAEFAEFFTIHANVENNEAINLGLDLILSIPMPPKYKSRVQLPNHQTSKSIGDRADELLREIDLLGDKIIEDDIVDIVILALQESNISIIVRDATAPGTLTNFSQRQSKVDIAIWSDEFDAWIGNPFLIEVKRSLMNKHQSNQVADGLLKYIHQYNTCSALALYLNRGSSVMEPPSTTSPNIFFLEVRELLSRLRNKSFVEIVHDLRNRRVHDIGA